MVIYILIFVCSIFLCYCAVYNPRNRELNNHPRIGLYAISASLLILMMGIREGVGTDYYSVYALEYNKLISEGLTYNNRFEPGFFLLMRLTAFFSGDYHILFFVVGFITIVLVYHAIYRLSDKPTWSVFIFLFGGFFFFATNGIRQALAVSILMNAVPYAIDRKCVHYISAVVLASFIHTSAIVFIPLYFFVGWKMNSFKATLFLILIVLFSGYIVDFALRISSAFSPQIARYASHEHLSNQYLSQGNIDLSDLISTVVAFMLYIITVTICRTNDKTDFLFFIVFIGLLTSILSKDMAIFSRMAMYFSPFIILAIPQLFHSLEEAGIVEVWIFKSLYFVFILASCMYLYGYLNFSSVIPYITLFGNG